MHGLIINPFRFAPAGPNIDADFWLDNENTGAVDATNLAAQDHNAGGTWRVTDTLSKLSFSTSGQQDLISTVNSTATTGSRGLGRDLNAGVAADATYELASSQTALSIVFALKTVALGSFSLGYEVLHIRDGTGVGGDNQTWRQWRDQGDGSHHINGPGAGGALTGKVAITEGNTYFIMIRWAQNAASEWRVYQTDGTTQVGSSQAFTGYNDVAVALRFFGLAANHAVVAYIDNVAVNWATAPALPYGP